jgi:hypothetical protein
MQTPKDRIALVTGANKGIGFEIARQLGQEGHQILIGARSGPGPNCRGRTREQRLRRSLCANRFDQVGHNSGRGSRHRSARGTAGYPDQQRGYHHFRRWVARCGQSRSRPKHLRHQFFRNTGGHPGDVAAIETISLRPHRQLVQRSWFSHANWRPEFRIRRVQVHRIWRFEGRTEHADCSARCRIEGLRH